MGRYDFRPTRVYAAATRLAETNRIPQFPAWHHTVGSIPTSQILVRPPPILHHEASPSKRKRKPSKTFMPRRITYEEDALRKQFFGDHPWELARPRSLVETGGRDYQNEDWSSLRQRNRTVDGESVVQRYLWLWKNNKNLTKAEAYEQARKEFYAERLQQEVEARVAKEEALATSAYFGKSRVQIGAELEDRTYEAWRRKAQENFVQLEQRRASAISSFAGSAEAETPADEAEVAQAAVGALEEDTEIQSTSRGPRPVPSGIR